MDILKPVDILADISYQTTFCEIDYKKNGHLKNPDLKQVQQKTLFFQNSDYCFSTIF